MRSRIWPALVALLVLGAAGPPAAGAVSFGAAVVTPATGAPFALASLIGLAPVPGSWSLSLTRTADAASARLSLAHAGGAHYRTVRLAWAAAGGVQSLCLDDVAITSYARHALPAGGGAIEHATLYFAAATRAPGPGACQRRPPPRPVVVRLYTDPAGGLHARVDCLAARCAGSLRIVCPAAAACPVAGLAAGAFALGPGREALLRVPLARPVRGRHPVLIAAVKLAGPALAFQARVVVDPPPPAGLPSLTSTAPSSSTSPAPPPPAGGGSAPATGSGPAGAGTGPDSGPVLGSPGGGTAGGGGTTGSGGTAGGGTGGGTAGGGGGGGGGGGQVDTTLDLTCDGPSGQPTGVHGTLGPSLVGAPIEIDYVPVDQNAPTVIHNIVTGAGGRFRDTARGVPFLGAVAFYAGDHTHVPAVGSCP